MDATANGVASNATDPIECHGPFRHVGAANSTALGAYATSTGANSVALGSASNDNGQANVVSVGNVGSERRVTNVANGTLGGWSTDAVNGSQLYVTNQAAAP